MKAGDLLARLDPSALASLQQAQAAYDRVRGQPNVGMQPEAPSLQKTTIEYERAQAALEAAKNHPTDSELATARVQVAQAEAQRIARLVVGAQTCNETGAIHGRPSVAVLCLCDDLLKAMRHREDPQCQMSGLSRLRWMERRVKPAPCGRE